MKARNFDTHFGRVGAFDIWTSEKYKSFVLMTATCPTASPMVRWAAKVLTETILDHRALPIKITIDVYDASSSDKKSVFTCVSSIFPVDPKLLMVYLKESKLSPPDEIKPTIDATNLSVGPCAYRNSKGLKWVKVRMPGYSVPFVLDKGEISWDRDETKQAILKNGIGGYLLDQIFKVLELKSTYIMERARKKLLNLSMIDEYAKHRMTFYREPEKGIYEPAVNADVAHPDYLPIIMFELGGLRHFVLMDDKIYRIPRFMSRRDVDDQGNPRVRVTPPVTAADGYFKASDITPINPEDTFTIDKIHRCIQNKL